MVPREEIFERAEKNLQMAAGLGGMLLCRLPTSKLSDYMKVFEKCQQNSEFAFGAGITAGSLVPTSLLA